ncbi:MAG: MliC family protein [Sulfurimonadaceae bacterium]
MFVRLFLVSLMSIHLFAEIKENSVFVYNCSDDYNFVVKVEQEEAWLFLPSKTVKAAQQISASGEKYSVGDVLLWSKGYEAVLNVGTKEYRCKNDGISAIWERAKLSGVAFRAIGNEPGWILEITSDKKVMFLTNLGQDKTYFEIIEKFSDHNSTEYEMRSQNNVLHVRIENRPCQDTMVDRVYESTVYIAFDGVNLRGCGRALY